MKAWTSRERMIAVLSGALPDRVPFAPTIYLDHACVACGKRFEEAIINPALGQECMLGAALRYGTDNVRFCMGPEASWYDDKLVAERDGKLVQLSRKSGAIEGYYDVQGGGTLIPIEKTGLVRTIQDVREIEVMSANEYLERGYLKDISQCVQKARGEGLFTVGMSTSQTINFMVDRMGSTTAALTVFYDDPELACALIDKAVAISIERCKAFIKINVDCLFIGDSYASGSVISPSIYRRFCAPAYAEVATELHKQGVFCYKHCCGNYDPLLDEVPITGVDAMDGIDPTRGMSVRHTKEKIGTKLTLNGGLSCLTLLNGTTEAVYEEAKQCVLDGKPGGRYILGSALRHAALYPARKHSGRAGRSDRLRHLLSCRRNYPMKALVPNPDNIRLAMLGMVDGNGHPCSWSAIINGDYETESVLACGYPGILQYLDAEPRENLGIPGAKVTHIWCDDPTEAAVVAKASLIPHVVKRPEDVIGQVDAVVIPTDKGWEHVDRVRPFIEAGLPVFIDKPLCDREDHLRQFVAWQREGKPLLSTSAMRYAKEFVAAKERLAECVGEPRLMTMTTAKSWERYGIHALEGVYPLLAPGGWLSAANTGTEKANLVHLRHQSGVDVVLAAVADMYGGFCKLTVYGTKGTMFVEFQDTFFAFKTQLVAFIDYLRTGESPFPFTETIELMKIIIAGIRSREKGGSTVALKEIVVQ